jgi:hypothetical protein
MCTAVEGVGCLQMELVPEFEQIIEVHTLFAVTTQLNLYVFFILDRAQKGEV